jgi:poly(A) polymerase
LKFQARYGFKIDSATEAAIHTCREEIVKSSPARILEEILRMLESGAAAPFFRLLAEYHFLSILFPHFMQALHTPQGKIVFHYLTCADQIHQHKKKVTLDRAILTSCLIYPLLEQELNQQFLSQNHIPHIGEITLVTSTLIKQILIHAFSHFPRRITSTMISILVAQYRITPLSGKRHYREKLFRHKDFDLALKFLKIRALVDAKYVEIYTSIRNQYRQFAHHGERKHHPRHGRHHHMKREHHRAPS